MDFQSFDKAMERAGEALFSSNDPERSLNIMYSIIKKFDPQRNFKGLDASTELLVACFTGSICPNNAIAVHISMAREIAATGSVIGLYAALQRLLVIAFFSCPKTSPSPTHSVAPRVVATLKPQFQLPSELWFEIATLLSRPDWKALLPVCHPLRTFAYRLYFQDILLHFGILGHVSEGTKYELEECERWHSRRSLWLIARILKDSQFANSVRSLKVYISNFAPHETSLEFEMGCLTAALHSLKRLKYLELYGSPHRLVELVPKLPQLVPWLEGLTFRYFTNGGHLEIPMPWESLRHLTIYPSIPDPLAYHDTFQQLGSCLRRLRISNHNSLLRLIVPLVHNLTHLELTSYWGKNAQESLLEVILSSGSCLESLHIAGLLWHQQSVYFKRYPQAMPHLRSFGVHFTPSTFTLPDHNLFPAILEFLQNKPLLESLELVLAGKSRFQSALGFNISIWEGLTSMPHLHTLCITVPSGMGPSVNMAQWIPRSVRTLTLKIWQFDTMSLIGVLAQGGWPDDLRFLGCFDNRHTPIIDSLVKVAASIPSVRVVRIGCQLFSVVGRGEGKPPKVERWTQRMSSVFRSETLEMHGCDDEYLYLKDLLL